MTDRAISGLRRRPLAVLVVEDELDQRGAVCRILEEEGHACFSAADGAEALRTLETVEPDVIVLDLVMGTMNGWDFLDALRLRPVGRPIPVVVISAVYDPRRGLGPVWYLRKPFGIEALVAAIGSAAAGGRLAALASGPR